ncbi:Nuclear aminoacylation-dependent tRNA export pathway component [Linderina pennispora]|nr:Nuclear aminoacylation-dependent tRNA export pathway component [Linderina pennispora]
MSGLSSYLYSTLSIVSNISGIGGSGIPDFHFTIGEAVEEYAGKSIWELHRANDKSEAAVFVFDKNRGSSYTAVAQNTLKRMRTIRHPGVLRYLEGTETADAIYIATEAVTPLAMHLEGDYSSELKRWGLYKISDTLRFINEDCKMIHANLSSSSVFVTRAGEWKLGGFEIMDTQAGSEQIFRHYTSVLPGYAARMAPEFESQAWDKVTGSKPGIVDGWYLACLIQQVYNSEVHSAAQMSSQGKIPQPLWQLCQKLLTPNLRLRLSPAKFLQMASRPGGFLDSPFITTSLFLENIAVKDDDEKTEFFAGLHSVIEGFPQDFSKYKILPELLKIMEFGGGDAKVLSGIIRIGQEMDEEEYNQLISPAIVQLFSSNDRRLRFSLLEYMGSFIQAIPSSVVSKKVLPNFLSGFSDAAPAIREATVKASLAIAPKLSQKSLNSDLLKQLVRMIADPEPGIRTNTLVCIGKLCAAKEGVLDLDGEGVNDNSYKYVICPAVMQAFRDQFPPVRSAALAVASACAAKWDALEIARRVIPSISPLLVDGERLVRTAALKTVQTMVARVEQHAKNMPDTLAKKPPAPTVPATANSAPTTPPPVRPTSTASPVAKTVSVAAPKPTSSVSMPPSFASSPEKSGWNDDDDDLLESDDDNDDDDDDGDDGDDGGWGNW